MRIRSVDNCSLPPFFLNGDLKQCRRMAVQDFGPDRFPSYFLSHRPLEPDASCPIPPQLPLGLSKSLDSATPWILIGHLVIGVVLSKPLERLPVFTKEGCSFRYGSKASISWTYHLLSVAPSLVGTSVALCSDRW